jgi:hypothetical protein
MAAAPKVRIIKYFGSATIQQTELDLSDAKSQLEYFWTKDGGSNITVSVDGQNLKSYDDLLAIAAQECYKNKAFIDVGLFLSNEGKKSIWSK